MSLKDAKKLLDQSELTYSKYRHAFTEERIAERELVEIENDILRSKIERFEKTKNLSRKKLHLSIAADECREIDAETVAAVNAVVDAEGSASNDQPKEQTATVSLNGADYNVKHRTNTLANKR